jgi:ATP-binding cassette subfamily C protein
MTGRLAARWGEASGRYMADQRLAADIAGGFGSLSKVLRLLLQSLVLGVGAYLVLRHSATAGVMIAGAIVMARALAPVELAIGNWRGFLAARQSWRRLADALRGSAVQTERMELPRPARSLLVQNVFATPPGRRNIVVHEVSFDLKAGDGLGVIGPSASGKSSLARLLVGVWAPVRGTIRLDGATLDQWMPESLGSHVGYVPQDVELMTGTVAENISRFDPAADPRSIMAAATKAGVHELVLQLPDGYETQIGEGGTVLSAGQRQRVALARALYGDPFLVVLDEPNSNLDSEGEEALMAAVRGVRDRGGIVVLIAHRRSVLAAVNKVLVMTAGKMRSFGPRDEVLSQLTRQTAAPPAAKQRSVGAMSSGQVPLKIVSDGEGNG